MFSNACKFTSSAADYTISCKIYSITGNVLIAEVVGWISLPAEAAVSERRNAKQCQGLIVACETYSD